jgi:O-methyltransferase involved in polyketide biosynthesis
MNKINIQRIKNIPGTMLIPLWARAVETGMPKPIILDKKACEIISMIDYDFSKFEKAWMSQVGVSIRTMILDDAVRHFINLYPEAVIINLGAGLDTRYTRLDGSRISCWYDLDLPEAIDLRKVFFNESKKNRFIAKSIFDFSWMDDVDDKGKPVLIIAEGLFMFFMEDELRPLFNALVKRFLAAEMLFEMLPPFAVGRSKYHDSLNKIEGQTEFKWGLKKSRDMEKWNTHIKFLEEWNYLEFHKKRWKSLRFMLLIPRFKNMFINRIVHLKFI